MLQSSELSYVIFLSRDAAPLGSILLWSLQLSFPHHLSESSSPHHQFLRSSRCLSGCSLPGEKCWGKLFKKEPVEDTACVHSHASTPTMEWEQAAWQRKGGAGQLLWLCLKQSKRKSNSAQVSHRIDPRVIKVGKGHQHLLVHPQAHPPHIN